MMRDARAPQTACGLARARVLLHNVERRGVAWLGAFACALAAAAVLICGHAGEAVAQDTSASVSSSGSKSSFKKDPGGPFGKFKRPDTAKPLHLQADQLIYDTSGDRVTARGNV
ncbi:MAG: hypothetical protein ABL908_17200, partial [Hyphomicrobium sp.]